MSKPQEHQEYAGAGDKIQEFWDLEYFAMTFGAAAEHASRNKTEWAQRNLSDMAQRMADAANAYYLASKKAGK